MKPVLAALLPTAQAAEPSKAQVQAEGQKDAQAGDPKPVASAKTETPAA